MTTRKISEYVIIAALVILIGYDIWAYLQKDDGTISVWIWAKSNKTDLIPFLFGFLMGHFFAPPQVLDE